MCSKSRVCILRFYRWYYFRGWVWEWVVVVEWRLKVKVLGDIIGFFGIIFDYGKEDRELVFGSFL